jgi:hypothetical protein
VVSLKLRLFLPLGVKAPMLTEWVVEWASESTWKSGIKITSDSTAGNCRAIAMIFALSLVLSQKMINLIEKN